MEFIKKSTSLGRGNKILILLFAISINACEKEIEWHFDTNYQNACLAEPYNPTDTLFEDFDLFNMRPICPVKEPQNGNYYVRLKKSANQTIITEVVWPEPTFDIIINHENGKHTSFNYLPTRPTMGYETIITTTYYSSYILEAELRNEWPGPKKNWKFVCFRVMDKGLSVYELYVKKQWNWGDPLFLENIACFKKISFNYKAHYTIFDDFCNCVYCQKGKDSIPDNNSDYLFRKVLKNWKYRNWI